jgi:MerR family transcriptional regulator/heat shock protein HspR
MGRRNPGDQAIYIISVAAELAGVHPQTLRVYERKGLVTPRRTRGNTRRYSDSDVERLRKIQELTQEGVNLAGVERIIELENELDRMKARYYRAAREADILRRDLSEAISARESSSLVPIKEVRLIRRALKVDVIDEAGRRRRFTAPPVAPPTSTEE